LTWGIDLGPSPTPFEQAQRLAAGAWGARRTWFLVNGASQGNIAAGLALSHHGDRVVLQRNGHSSTIDSLILSGMRPTFVAPEIDEELGIAHCITPDSLQRALEQTPGAVADVRGLAEVAHAHDVPLVVDEAWGAHLAFSDALPEHALAAGADLVISSTHKIVGSLTQSAMLHLGGGRIDGDIVDRAVTLTESTSPNALLCASLDAARRRAVVEGSDLIAQSAAAADHAREQIRAIPGLDVLDGSFIGRAGVHGYDPLRLAVDVRGLAIDGYELARRLRETADIHLELAAQNVVVGVFGMGGEPESLAERFVDALRTVAAAAGLAGDDASHVGFAPAPPWGELVMTPREAFLGVQEVVAADDAVGRIAAESLATYPPGIPNVLPGERLTAETLAYIRRTLELGGSVRGASDRLLHTVRVVAARGGAATM
jgi:arginine decarboxylase